jgi:hypothetical protein
MKKTLAKIIVVAVVVGALSFYGGMKYGQGSVQTATRQLGGQPGQQRTGGVGSFGTGRQGGAGQNGGFAGGTIISKDSRSITVKLRDNSSKIVFVSGSTPVTKSVSGSVGDLAVGDDVTVAGTANSDGSITAQSVQIRPASGANGPAAGQ